MLFAHERYLKPNLGFGDAWLSLPIVEHFLGVGERVRVETFYPEVYSYLAGESLVLNAVRGDPIWIRKNLNYEPFMQRSTNIFEEMCDCLGLMGLSLTVNQPVRYFLPPCDRPTVVVRVPAKICKYYDNGDDALPDFRRFGRVVELIRSECRVVLVGNRSDISSDVPCDIDLTGERKTEFDKLVGSVSGSDLIFTQHGHMIHIGEALCRPVFAFYSYRSLIHPDPRIRRHAPHKVFTKPSSKFCFDADPIDLSARRAVRMAQEHHACRPLLGCA